MGMSPASPLGQPQQLGGNDQFSVRPQMGPMINPQRRMPMYRPGMGPQRMAPMGQSGMPTPRWQMGQGQAALPPESRAGAPMQQPIPPESMGQPRPMGRGDMMGAPPPPPGTPWGMQQGPPPGMGRMGAQMESSGMGGGQGPSMINPQRRNPYSIRSTTPSGGAGPSPLSEGMASSGGLY